MSFRKIITEALTEDLGGGDITSRLVIDTSLEGEARIFAKQEMILSGVEVARQTFLAVDQGVHFEGRALEGDRLKTGDDIAHVSGSMASLLIAERTALNFMQRMSGIATLTAEYVFEVQGTGARITDTRKTAPGLRVLDKMAVRAGGGINHRMGLFDGILIKDNHIVACGGVAEAVSKAKSGASHLIRIEVEVTNLDELDQALEAGAEAILLDNMDTDMLARAVKVAKGKAMLEASGNIGLDNVAEVAKTGVDIISVGKITHSAPAADIAMDVTQN